MRKNLILLIVCRGSRSSSVSVAKERAAVEEDKVGKALANTTLSRELYMHIYIYICIVHGIYTHTHIYIYVYNISSLDLQKDPNPRGVGIFG